MTANFAQTPEQVKRAVETVIKNNPSYADILGFYGRLFGAQEESKRHLHIEPLQIPDDVRAVKTREKFPLIEIKDFIYDKAEASRLFITIGRLAAQANPKLADSASILLEAVDSKLDPAGLFLALLNGNEAFFENIVLEFEVEKQVLGFITYHSLKPSLTMGAEQLASYLNKNEPWLKGYCPICGSAPILSTLEGEGERKLICSFCWHTWPVKRVCCPFCDNSDNKALHYLYNEEEKDLRIDLCNNCRRYLKTIDTRQADRLIYPPLEQISTLHLDIKAQEEGFDAGLKLNI
ncbi:formate dehydrogenase formation protein FdhE [Olavius algarvensis Delta 1 endosymbiont]|nr:formate dehydrogenase formation protein FdhE [Olavius algarvensis Delta 1 endosymbiont]